MSKYELTTNNGTVTYKYINYIDKEIEVSLQKLFLNSFQLYFSLVKSFYYKDRNLINLLI